MDKEKDIEGLQKDLANYKVQLEAKDAAYLQLLHKLEHYQKTAEEFSVQLKNSEVERDFYCEECGEARVRANELEAKVKEMTDQLLDTGKVKEQLSHVLGELKAAQGEVLSMETELVAAREEKLKVLTQAKMVETAANIEKERAEQLLKRVSELNQAISLSRQASFDAQKEITNFFPEKNDETEDIRKQEEMIHELECQLLSKSVFIDLLQVELNQANELLSSSDKIVSDAMNDLNKLKENLKDKEKENSDRAVYVGVLESEMNMLKKELESANDEATRLNSNVGKLTDELEKVNIEMVEMKVRENEAEVEIALLKAELHKARAKLAAAEAAEARAGNVQSGLYLAVQQLSDEAEHFKKENRRLKQESDEYGPASEMMAEADEEIVDDDGKITISLKEYASLTRKAEKANHCPRKDTNLSSTSGNKYELEILKKELETAIAKVAEFRTRAEQAVTRAEAAERAKLSLEDQLRKWREQKQRRKAALAALREESLSREFCSSSYDNNTPRNHQPLGKVLNIKF
ncbi:protein WEAK CHLOROPLAST MOVEMENT UNDER BLUE LIGHT-like 1 isoform X2 [Ricinus communis]|nr:protein WEAK CHLOROPLAST MOVEMENT UNDER BLUE LIGHT-like 1 isoform X2 [Ricinus communis]